MAVKKGTAKKKAPAKKKAVAKKAPAKKKTAVKKAPAKRKVASKKTVSQKAGVKKTAAKKSPIKKSPAKKAAPKKKAAAKKPVAAKRKLTAISQRYSKTEIINELAINSGLNRKQVGTVIDELAILISRHVKKRAVGEFALAGLIKITTAKRPAKKATKGINPFTGKMTTFKAKPARTAVKVHPLKGLVDIAQ
jgi:nucleoid DNA-binding protein